MLYVSSVHGQAYHIDPADDSPQKTVILNGVEYRVDWRHIAPLVADAEGTIGRGGRYSLIIGDKSYDVFARRLNDPDEKAVQTYEVLIAGERFEVQVEDEREKVLAGAIKPIHDTGEALVKAPMPGLVIGTPVEAGDEVARGQTVVVLEAMKMENDLASPRSGIVKEIRVHKGQTVNQGQVLVVVVGE